MVNPLPEEMLGGTFGELLVQIRFLQYGVQAVSPHKDSGNDLLAFRGRSFRPVQVKTTSIAPISFNVEKALARDWDLLALVLIGKCRVEASNHIDVSLDSCRTFLLMRTQVTKGYFTVVELAPFEMSHERVEQCFN